MAADTQTLTLTHRKHEKLGHLHCGVTREGLIVVAGEQQEIADGDQVRMQKTNVLVSRKGEEYTFASESA
jgi:hypothetical protein